MIEVVTENRRLDPLKAARITFMPPRIAVIHGSGRFPFHSARGIGARSADGRMRRAAGRGHRERGGFGAKGESREELVELKLGRVEAEQSHSTAV